MYSTLNLKYNLTSSYKTHINTAPPLTGSSFVSKDHKTFINCTLTPRPNVELFMRQTRL